VYLAVHFDVLHAGHGCGVVLLLCRQPCVELSALVGGVLLRWVATLPACSSASDGGTIYSNAALQRADMADEQKIEGACGSPEADKLHGGLAASRAADGDTFVPSETESLVAVQTSRRGLEWRQQTAQSKQAAPSAARRLCMHISNAMAGSTVERPWSPRISLTPTPAQGPPATMNPPSTSLFAPMPFSAAHLSRACPLDS
jgi:hypothetical protein